MERNSRQNFEVKASHFACSTIKRSAGVSALWKNGVRIAAFRSHGRAPAIREAGAPNVSFSRGAVPWKIIRRTTMGTSSLPARLSKHMNTSRRCAPGFVDRSEEHTSELQSLMRISYAVFCLKKKKKKEVILTTIHTTKQQ